MLEKVFLSILNMSITASWVILAVILVRFLIKKLPGKYAYMLWAIVGFRLLCPVSISSAFSFFNLKNFGKLRSGNRMEYVPADIGLAKQPQVNLGAAPVNQIVNHSLPAPVDVANSVNPLQVWIIVGSWIWILGITVVFLYAVISLMRTYRTVYKATRLKENIYECDNIPSPFVLGMRKPRIYIPYRLTQKEQEYILTHEQFHIRRMDHWIKMLAFLLLMVYWFNPLVWIAYILMSQDMEMSCDEAVLARFGNEVKKEYSSLLVSFSANYRHLSLGPLAFGESDVAQRIKNILHFHAPKVWMSAVGIAVVVLIAAVCMTNGTQEKDVLTQNSGLQSNETKENSSGTKENSQGTKENSQGTKESSYGTKESSYETEESSHGTEKNSYGTQSDQIFLRQDKKQLRAMTEEQLRYWAVAFCGRDGEALLKMCTDEVKWSFVDRELLEAAESGISFGMSSPWPWQPEADFRIVEISDNQAVILYYAQTSDPHVTVWRETLQFQVQEEKILIDKEELRIMEYICTAEEFMLAYPQGINGTEMDYLANGMGESLNRNALLSSSFLYQDLFEPSRAATEQLNLLDNPNKVQIREALPAQDGSVELVLYFAEDGGTVYLRMVQPYGSQGIWVVQDSQQIESVDEKRYSDYQTFEEMLGEGFLEEFYELESSRKTDVVDGLETEVVEVYTGNIGDGDSGYVLIRNSQGKLLYDEFAHAARAGWNNIYLCKDRYLMTVHIEDRGTFGEYSYQVFRLDPSGRQVVLDTDSYVWDYEEGEKGDFESFTQKLQTYLQESFLLLSTQEGELNTEHISEAFKYTSEALKKMETVQDE